MKHKLYAPANGTPIENTNDQMDFPRVAFTCEYASYICIVPSKFLTTSLIISSGYESTPLIERDAVIILLFCPRKQDRAHFNIVIWSRYIITIILSASKMHFALFRLYSLACFILFQSEETQYLSFYRVYYAKRRVERKSGSRQIDYSAVGVVQVPLKCRRKGCNVVYITRTLLACSPGQNLIKTHEASLRPRNKRARKPKRMPNSFISHAILFLQSRMYVHAVEER